MKRLRCQSCEKISLSSELLTAPNPFDASEMISGCPLCKSIEGFDELCDEPGCGQGASCGFPAGPEFGGYRRTCFKHYKFAMTTEGRQALTRELETLKQSIGSVPGPAEVAP